mmetsp:Transcript_105920/g.167114  ORF Transcript_105920/g.167114 Transcript_105920/m.167114 type:complete len:91 (-) Transcript_105920:52-324(-)
MNNLAASICFPQSELGPPAPPPAAQPAQHLDENAESEDTKTACQKFGWGVENPRIENKIEAFCRVEGVGPNSTHMHHYARAMAEKRSGSS